MESDHPVSESSALDDLLESRLLQLLSRIGQASPEEIETELTSLTAIIDSYARNDELLEGLLDPRTTDDDRSQMRKALGEHRRLLEQGRVELQRLHEKSQALLVRSVQLLRAGSRQVYQKKDASGSRYAPEICAYCKGIGRSNRKACPACLGARLVLVHQPALKCPRCNGSGRPDDHDRIEYYQDFCVICRGKGWAMTAH
jgi:hypothetical protein